MTDRSPESMLHELDYWKHILDDIREISDLVTDAAEPLPHAAIAALSLVMGADMLAAADQISEYVRDSMVVLARMDEPINRILSLIEGRQLALQAEQVA